MEKQNKTKEEKIESAVELEKWQFRVIELVQYKWERLLFVIICTCVIV